MIQRIIVLSPPVTLSLLFHTSLAQVRLTSSHRVSLVDVLQGDTPGWKASDGVDLRVDREDTRADPTVVACLRQANVDTVDVVVMSHGHADQVGGQLLPTATCLTVGASIQNRGLTPTAAAASQCRSWRALDANTLGPHLHPEPTKTRIPRLGPSPVDSIGSPAQMTGAPLPKLTRGQLHSEPRCADTCRYRP